LSVTIHHFSHNDDPMSPEISSGCLYPMCTHIPQINPATLTIEIDTVLKSNSTYSSYWFQTLSKKCNQLEEKISLTSGLHPLGMLLNLILKITFTLSKSELNNFVTQGSEEYL
jgi:hypothetical protein